MKPVVYVDILFLLNFFVNTVIIYISFLITKEQIKLWRHALSAGFLALYACIIFFPRVQILYSILGKCAVLIISSLIAYPTKSIVKLIKNTVILFLATVILGGIVFLLIFTTNFGISLESAVSNGEFYFNINASTLLISIILAYFSVYIAAEIKRLNKIKNNKISDITIVLGDKELTLKGFFDTGCTICEPLSKAPAIIINKKAAKSLFDDQKTVDNFKDKYRVIPYSTINNKRGFLYAVFPDMIKIDECMIKKAIVAIAKDDLSADGSFDAIYGTEIYEETIFSERTA